MLVLILSVACLHANNFRNGMKAYKQGSYQKARFFFELAMSEDRATHANFMLGKMYLYGLGVPNDTQKAITVFQEAFDSGNIPAGCYLSEAYMQEGSHASLLAEGLMPGLIKRVPHCKRVLQMYQNYDFSKASYN